MKEARLLRLGLVFALLFCVLVGRLYHMQVVEGEEWTQEAYRSRLQTQSLPFHRGRILDRNGVVLAVDERAWDLQFEYRAFRRAHPAGQLLETYALAGQAPGGLAYCLEHAEALLAGLCAWTPDTLARLSAGERADWLYYLRRLGEFPDSAALGDWSEHGEGTLAQAFPRAFAHFPERVAAAATALERLEQVLDMRPGQLLDELEEQRLELERRVRDQALLQAAGRGSGLSGYEVVELLASAGEDAPARAAFLAELAARWRLQATPEGLESLAAVLLGERDRGSERQRLEQGRVLRHVETVAPGDLADVRRELIRDLHRSRPVRLRKDVSFAVVDLIEQDPDAYPGIRVVENPHREYPGSVAPQLLGLVQAPTERELRHYYDLRDEERALARLLDLSPEQERRYRAVRAALAAIVRPGEVRGGFGVEAACEAELRGLRGNFEVLHDSEERPPTELRYEAPVSGQDVVLTLDLSLQRAAEQAIAAGYALARAEAQAKEAPAAVLAALAAPRCGFVVLDLRDGTLPVLASVPSYTVSQYRREYTGLVQDPSRPLRQRALAGNFTAGQTPYPGSTLKLVVAVEALAQDPGWWTRALDCGGEYQPAGASRALRCEGVHGGITMRAAIAQSCNVYFYRLGEALGYEALYRRARQLGFGAPSGLDLTCRAGSDGFELAGPNAILERGAFLLRPSGQISERAAASLLAIGQSHVTSSPLQMARAYGWLACGKLWAPRLVLQRGSEFTTPVFEPVARPEPALAQLGQALRDVVEDPRGTAYDPEHDLGQFRVAGKTGTAQALEARRSGEPELHGWFAGYFPYEDPRYAFAILCENAGVHGGDSANLVLYEFLRSSAGLLLR